LANPHRKTDTQQFHANRPRNIAVLFDNGDICVCNDSSGFMVDRNDAEQLWQVLSDLLAGVTEVSRG
jgi:hypothetical protein